MFKYFPHTSEDIREMLDVIGVKSLEDLYAEIPEELKFKGELNMPSAMSEVEVRQHIQALAEANIVPEECYAGCGVYDHYQPSVVPYITARSEFSTSYTPYQAEISQGTLQYIFEYQTMMADLTGMDISNASMYDGSTATAEAMLMCVANAKKRNKVLVAATFLPQILNVVQTYAHYHGVDVVLVPEKEGVMDKDAAVALLEADDVAGLICCQHNRYGIIEDFTGLAEACHAHKALLAINSVASDLAVLRTPGEWGADIACGDAQSLGIPMGYGGPYIGYLCVKEALVRRMPGRLVGATTDANGQRAFVLTMQAREQHIRREKATSNICTAQGYMCLFVASYLALMGERGLREVNELGYSGAHLLHDKLLETGFFEDAFPGKLFLNEFTLRLKKGVAADFVRHMLECALVLPGVAVADDLLTVAVTEKYGPDSVEDYVESAKIYFSEL
ncbi:MAG: aminomethyl-transferring glycine dehydrogenase subunit GcvPA [Bacteroidaceae bacterium]|nr:aminomethyl-transferring glycine dehydrogenase subunit GcvPA [Bacteroidaceae bacterium]